MGRPLHIIYIPGFGDNYDIGRRIFLVCWRIFGVTTEFIPMRWDSSESYNEKQKRVNAAIDKATNKRVVLIGESAGGSIVVPMYAKRYTDLYKVMTICGKNSGATSVSPHLYKKHRAFREAMRATDLAGPEISSRYLRKFIAFHPIYDGIIPLKETVIPGCKSIQFPSIGHLLTIFLSLTLFSGYIVHIAARRD